MTSLRGIIRDESNLEMLKSELTEPFNKEIKILTETNDKQTNENMSIKRLLHEHQKYLEKIRRAETKNNIFISGIPNILKIDLLSIPNDDNGEETTTDHVEIIHHILNFVNPGISTEQYKVPVNFNAKGKLLPSLCKSIY